MNRDEQLCAIDQLVAGQRDVVLPFVLKLQHETSLDLVASLRLLPGKRLSARASWGGRAVMAKLFVRARRGDVHAAAESQGHRCVVAAGIDTPALLWQGLSACGRLAVVLYEFLDEARSFADVYERDSSRRAESVTSLLALTATLHAHNAFQSDPHLDNLLWHRGVVWLIDVGSVVARTSALSRTERERNLALLLAQLPLLDQMHAAMWCEQYNAACTRHELDAVDVVVLEQAISRAWRGRCENVVAKAQRDCSATHVERHWQRFVACRRSYLDQTLQALLANIDQAMSAGKMLKDGNSATVVLVERGRRRWVIKRYNMKSLWHRLRRCLRPSRAMQSWRNAHLLEFAGITTPTPVAVIEARCGPLRGRAWFVSEFVQADEMLSVYQQREPTQHELEQTLSIFRTMQRALISHGDLKAQNLMIGDDGIVRMIDLDAMRWHRSMARWRKAFTSDIRRFLHNWQGTLRQRFALLLKEFAAEGSSDG